MPHIRPFLSMIVPGVGMLWATRQGSCLRRQDARHRGISDTNFWPDTFAGDSP
jgi:hypothetical protein